MSVRIFVIVYIQRPCSLNSPLYMCNEGVYFTHLLLVVTFSTEHASQVILEHFVQFFPGTVLTMYMVDVAYKTFLILSA